MNKIFQSVATLTAGVLVAAALTAGAAPAFADDTAPELETPITEVVDETPGEETIPEELPEVIEEDAAEDEAPADEAELVAPGAVEWLTVTLNQLNTLISWDEPVETGGDTATLRYSVVIESEGGSLIELDTADLSVSTDQLVPLTSYTVGVTAYNEAGEGTTVFSESFVAGDSAPNAIANPFLSVISSNGGLGVDATWNSTNPEYMDGLVTYEVNVYFDGALFDTFETSTENATIESVPGGTNIRVEITSIFNGHRSSAVSTSTIVEASAPGTPEVTAIVNGTSITTNWLTPNDGGSAITGYTFELLVAGEVVYTEETPAFFNSRLSAGLEPNTLYTGRVTAHNAIGSSSAGEDSVTTPVIAPSAARALVFSNGVLNWSAPVSNGGEAVVYDVAIFNADNELVESSNGVSATTYAIEADYSEGVFTASVTARNSAGASVATTISFREAVAPGAPTAVKLSVTSVNSLSGTWTAPVETGDSAISGYLVQLTNVTRGLSTVVETTATSINFANLEADSEYSFTVLAINEAGAGAVSVASNSVFTAPAAITDLLTEAEAKELAKNLPAVGVTINNGVLTVNVAPNQWFFGVAYSEPTALGWAYSGAAGVVSYDISSLPAGAHTFLIYDANGNAIGAASFSIAGAAAAGTDGKLANSGFELNNGVTYAGVIALLLGLALVVVARRRKVEVTAAD